MFVFCVPTLTVITVVPVQMFQVDVQKAKADQGFGRRGGRGGYDGGRGYGGRGGEIDLTVVHDDYKCRLNNKTNVFVVFLTIHDSPTVSNTPGPWIFNFYVLVHFGVPCVMCMAERCLMV